jgi:uncharacterized membrane protein
MPIHEQAYLYSTGVVTILYLLSASAIVYRGKFWEFFGPLFGFGSIILFLWALAFLHFTR